MKSFSHFRMGNPGGATPLARIPPFNIDSTFASPSDQKVPSSLATYNLLFGAGFITGASPTITTPAIVGTVAADNAAAGNVGEYAETLVAVASAVSFATNTAKTVMSVSLTAGDWDVEGNINFVTTTATFSAIQGGINTTNNTLPNDGSEVYSGVQGTLLSETDGITLPRKRINVSSPTTVYLVGKITFSAGSAKGYGKITARRVR